MAATSEALMLRHATAAQEQRKEIEAMRKSIEERLLQLAKTGSHEEFIKIYNQYERILDLCAQDLQTGDTYLHSAIKQGQTDFVMEIIQHVLVKILTNGHLDTRFFTRQNKQGYTARDLAIHLKQTEISTGIVRVENNLFKSKIYNEQTWQILKETDFQTFKKFVQSNKITPNFKPLQSQNCLLLSLNNGDRDYRQKLKFLIVECGGNPNLKYPEDCFNNTLLHYLLINESREEALELFSYASDPEIQLDMNAQDLNGRTALMLAVAIGLDDIIESILKKGPALGLQINIQDKNGFTALHFASFLRNNKAITWLRNAGASGTATDKRGRTAVQLLDPKHDAELKQIMDGLEIDILRDKNASSNLLEDSNRIPILNLEKLRKANLCNNRNQILNSNKLLTILVDPKQKIKFEVLSSKKEWIETSPENLGVLAHGSKLVSLISPHAKADLDCVKKVVANFSGVSLQEYILCPNITATARSFLNLPLQSLKMLLPQQKDLGAIRDSLLLFGLNVLARRNTYQGTLAELATSYLTLDYDGNQDGKPNTKIQTETAMIVTQPVNGQTAAAGTQPEATAATTARKKKNRKKKK